MDKNKVIEGAAKLVAKGAYDKAIKEYQKLLDADPRDVRALQKMGELYQKKNENAQAAHYFIKVAEAYSADGFFLKAVALYKQVLKLNPALVEINLKLAELHQQLGLMSEATTYYQAIATHHDKAGDIRASLDILKKMVDLDPENVSSRIKLGDLYAREGMAREATAEFKRAADHLKRAGRTEEYLRVAERLATLEPENLALNRELAVSSLQQGDQKRALARLQVCFKADPQDVETLQLLAQAFQGLGQVAKTVSVYKELAKVYAERGLAAKADAVWANIQALDPSDPDLAAYQQGPAASPTSSSTSSPTSSPTQASPPARPASSPPPSAPAAAPAPLTPPLAAPLSSREQLTKVLTETDVYVKYGLHDKALEHLRKVFAVDPEHLDAHEKAYQIYVAASQPAQAAEQLLNVLRLCTRRGEIERAQPYLATLLQTQPHHPEVPAFLAVLRREGVSAGPPEEAASEDALLVVSGTEDVEVGAPPADALGHFTMEDVARMSARRRQPDEAPALLAEDDGGTYSDEDAFHVVAEDEPVSGADDDVLVLARASVEEEARGELVTEPLDVGEEVGGEEAEEPASEELDEAEFFMDQGLLEEALELLETVAIAFPGHKRAARLRARLDALEAGEAAGAEAAAPAVAETDAFDLAQELAGDFDALAEASPQAAAEDFQYTVEEVFNEFKKGLEKVVKPGDVDTHYDLGIAYKEMGLVEDAISEFLVARKGCVGKKKEVDCLTMVGLLQRERGDHEAAVATFKEALGSDHATGDAHKALLFELALTYEALGSPGRALSHYQRVAQLDGAYRDVGGMVARLRVKTAPEPDELPRRPASGAAPARPGAAPASRKVGYV